MKKYIGMSLLFALSSIALIKGAEEDPISHRGHSPANYRALLDHAVINGDVRTVMAILTSEDQNYPDLINLKYKYPFAIKLYKILMDDTTGEDFTEEAEYIPFEKITYMVKQLAIEGGSERFLKKMTVKD